MKVSKKVAGVEYAIRDIVSAAREIEKQGKTVDYLNIGDPVQFGFQPPENVKRALINATDSFLRLVSANRFGQISVSIMINSLGFTSRNVLFTMKFRSNGK